MNKLQRLLETRKSNAGLDSSGSGPVREPEPVNEKPRPASAKAETSQKYPEPSIDYITDPVKAGKVIAGLPEHEVIGLDIETMKEPAFKNHRQAGLCPHLSRIRLVQICPDPEAAYVFDVMKMGIDALKGLWGHRFAAHNAIFEIKHLYHAGIVLEPPDCTLLQYNALHGGRPALKFIAKKFMKMDISKVEQASDWSVPELSEEQIRYAAIDAWVVRIAHRNFERRMAGKKQESIYALMCDAQNAIAKMEYYGMNFDAVGHLTIIEQWKKELEGAEKALRDVVGAGVLLSSNKQLSDFLKAHLGKAILKRWETTKSGDLCLDKDTVHQFGHLEAVAPLAEYKRLSKLISSFGEGLLEHVNPKTGRIHAEYALAGTRTGRFTCSKPNVQQIPRDKALRGLFKTPENRVLVVADYSQIELRVLAMLSKEPVMLATYEKGEDLHRLTASKITGVPLDEVSDEHRRMAKAINFGLVFGMGARSLADYARNTYGVTMTNKQAKEARDAYFESYPVVVRWQHKVTKASQTYNNAATRMGRVIKLNPEKVYTQSKNYPVQGSAADVMLAALKIVDREITRQELDIRIVCCVHDEIHLEAPEDLAEQAKSLLEECMVAGMLEVFPEASTKNLVEAAVGKSWGEAK